MYSITNVHWFFRVKTSSFQCEKVKPDTFSSKIKKQKTELMSNLKPPSETNYLPAQEWQYVKNKVGVSSRSVVNEHHGENRKHLKNHMMKGRKPFCETFDCKSTNCRSIYVKPYYEMLQVLKQHTKFLLIKKKCLKNMHSRKVFE